MQGFIDNMIDFKRTMEWDKSTLDKYNKMIQLIPIFHRGIAEKVVNVKAEEDARARGSSVVQEEDVVRAFFAEAPKDFYNLMISAMGEAAFNYKPYMEK